MQPVVAVMCALLAAAEAPIKDIPPVDNIIKQLESGKLMPKDVAAMMPIMTLTNLIDLKLKLGDDILQVMAFMPGPRDLPSVDDLIEQLRSGNLSGTDITNMTLRMSLQYMMTLVHHLPGALLPQCNKDLHSLPESAPDAEDLPSGNELLEQQKSGNLSQKDMMNMTLSKLGQHLMDGPPNLSVELLQKVHEYVQSLPSSAANARYFPSVDELIEKLQSDNLSQKDVANMTSWMSREDLLYVLHSLPDKLRKQVDDFGQTDAPRGSDSATNETNEKLDQNQLPLYLSLGIGLPLAVLVVILLLLIRRRCCGQPLTTKKYLVVARLDPADPAVDDQQCDAPGEEPAAAAV